MTEIQSSVVACSILGASENDEVFYWDTVRFSVSNISWYRIRALQVDTAPFAVGSRMHLQNTQIPLYPRVRVFRYEIPLSRRRRR